MKVYRISEICFWEHGYLNHDWVSSALCFLFMLNLIWASSMYLIFPLVPMATLYCVASSRFCCTRFPLEAWYSGTGISLLPPTKSFLCSPKRGSLDHLNQSRTARTAKWGLSYHVYSIRKFKNFVTPDLFSVSLMKIFADRKQEWEGQNCFLQRPLTKCVYAYSMYFILVV